MAAVLCLVTVCAHATPRDRIPPSGRFVCSPGVLTGGSAPDVVAFTVVGTGPGGRSRVELTAATTGTGDTVSTWDGRAVARRRGRWKIVARSQSGPRRRLVARLDVAAGTLRGRIRMAGAAPVRFESVTSRCGDGVVDLGGDEQCEDAEQCFSAPCVACRCADPGVPVASPPDPTFGDGGRVSPLEGSSYPLDVVVRPDDRILVLASGPAMEYLVLLVQLLPDGALDPTFGIGGVVETDLRASGSNALVIYDDDRVLVSGSREEHPALQRFDPQGRPDPTFGSASIVTLAAQPILPRVALPDDRLPLAFADELTRLLPDGSVDPAIGSVRVVPLPNVGDAREDGSVSSFDQGAFDLQGRFVTTHLFFDGAELRARCATRFTVDGSVDGAFLGGFSARVVVDPPVLHAPANCLFVEGYPGQHAGVGTFAAPDGTLFFTAYDSFSAVPTRTSLLRSSADGTTWVSAPEPCSGALFLHGYDCDLWRPSAVDGEGRLLVRGDFESSRPIPQRIGRLLVDLTPDPSFGSDGLLFVPGARALALQSDGAIVVAGREGDERRLTITRYRE